MRSARRLSTENHSAYPLRSSRPVVEKKIQYALSL
jgi:hypothetical protein